jgi:hypothetical protein
MANAPLAGKGRGELVELICPTAEAKYFLKEGWTGFCREDRFARRVILPRFADQVTGMATKT